MTWSRYRPTDTPKAYVLAKDPEAYLREVLRATAPDFRYVVRGAKGRTYAYGPSTPHAWRAAAWALGMKEKRKP